MFVIALLSTVVRQDDAYVYSIIDQAPQKYQRMLRAFKYQDFQKIRTYCKPRLRIECCALVRPGDKDFSGVKNKTDGPLIDTKVYWIRRDSKKKKEVDDLNRKFQDFLEGIAGMSTNKKYWLPKSGPLDIVDHSGYGFAGRPCAGYYVRLQIDPKDSKHPICGWFETVR